MISLPVSVELFSRQPLLADHSRTLKGPNAIAASSQQDLTTTEIALSKRFSKNDDSGDIEGRGKELASRCWAEDEDFLAKEKIAEWLGGQ